MNKRRAGGVVYLTSSVLQTPHAFSTRLGGVSTGSLSSLNLGAGRGDRPENVAENWRRFGEAAGIPTEKFVHGKQVHGKTVRIASREDAHGILETAAWPGADGYVTDVPGLPLAVFTADCAPLLLHDPAAGIVGAVHCGWRSTVADIEAEALGAMDAMGAQARNIRAAVGPCLGPCCFETGPEVPEALYTLLSGDTAGLVAPEEGKKDKFLVDLPEAVARRLIQLGVAPDNIELSGECTMCHPETYWSYRVDGDARGSMASVIML